MLMATEELRSLIDLLWADPLKMRFSITKCNPKKEEMKNRETHFKILLFVSICFKKVSEQENSFRKHWPSWPSNWERKLVQDNLGNWSHSSKYRGFPLFQIQGLPKFKLSKYTYDAHTSVNKNPSNQIKKVKRTLFLTLTVRLCMMGTFISGWVFNDISMIFQ